MLRKEFAKGAVYLYGLTLSLLLFLLGIDYFLGTQFLYEGIIRAGDTFNTADKNVVGRGYAIINNFQVFLSKPILGIGYNYEDMAKSFNLPIGPNVKNDFYNNILHPHNFIMRFLSHTGLVGTTLIISFIVLIYKKAWTIFKYSPSMKDFGIFVLCSITFFLSFSLMNTTFFTTGASLFWFLSGLIVTTPKWSQ
jgi:O-antigen ligase